MPKGWEYHGSPDWNIDRIFLFQFYFQKLVKKPSTPRKTFRNPIYLAKEYKQMITSGQVKNQSKLARKLSISRARVTQILNLLKLDSLIIQELEKLGDTLESRIISERMLRQYVNKSTFEQKVLLNILKTLFPL